MFSFFKKKAPSPPPEQDRVQEPEVAPVPAPVPGVAERPDAPVVDRPVAPQADPGRDAVPAGLADSVADARPVSPEPAVPAVAAPAAPIQPPSMPPVPQAAPPAKSSWLARLKTGLSRTGQSLTTLFVGVKVDEDLFEELETALIMADTGVDAAQSLLKGLRERVRQERIEDGDSVRRVLRELLAEHLRPLERRFDLDRPAPIVTMIAGVNGAGKTTSIGKLARTFQQQGRHVLLAAGDTFRAAAIGQLQVWADRIGVPIVTGPEQGDPASVVFDAVKAATATGIDALVVDTAGRLHNKRELMDELAKVRRVLGRLDPASPHDVVLVLDATNGQNALQQIEIFREVAGVTGLIMTKLDGTARGGVLVAAAEQYGLPIHAIGVGEGVDDLRPFDPDLVARVIAGLAQ